LNIFVVDECPVLSAAELPDKYSVKMPLETCQMISVIYSPWYYNWGTIPKKDGTPYKTQKGAFRNHPCVIWSSQSYHNLAWLIRHGYALCNEYRHRYGKIHSCLDALYVAENMFTQQTNEDIGIYKNVKSFVRAMPDNIKYDDTIDDATAYRKYVNTKEWVSSNYLRCPERKPQWVI
tara:strand:+ start:352 stop:882 length:531 start_codon:yes stop_codon:yes gene_type:complete